jgi:hypothetical protein
MTATPAVTRVQLLGGPWDGREIAVDGDLPQVLCAALPLPPVDLAAPDNTPWRPPPIAYYYLTAARSSDGTRVFRYGGQS